MLSGDALFDYYYSFGSSTPLIKCFPLPLVMPPGLFLFLFGAAWLLYNLWSPIPTNVSSRHSLGLLFTELNEKIL